MLLTYQAEIITKAVERATVLIGHDYYIRLDDLAAFFNNKNEFSVVHYRPKPMGKATTL